jgi:hypothetical protein
MRDPTINLVVKELTEITIQYLCERELQELNDSINASFARSKERLRSWIWSACATRLEWCPHARKRGRPPQRRDRHVQIAGAVALLVENGLNSTRSHCKPCSRNPSVPWRSNSWMSIWTNEPSKAFGIDTTDRFA